MTTLVNYTSYSTESVKYGPSAYATMETIELGRTEPGQRIGYRRGKAIERVRIDEGERKRRRREEERKERGRRGGM